MAVSSIHGVSASVGLKAALKSAVPRCLFVRRLRRDAGKRVLLTFDDGPNPEVTTRVLDRLEVHDAKAVFFVIGRHARRAPHLVREIVRRGHIVGNHSHLHQDDYVLGGPKLTLPRYYLDCRRCQIVVRRSMDSAPRFFRPPGGRISTVTLLVPWLLRLRVVGWSAEVADWRFRTDLEAREGAARLLAEVRARDIVLLHDNNPSVLPLLDLLLPGLRERGYDLSSSCAFI